MACLMLLARSFDACLINISGAAHAADASESAVYGVVYIVQVKRMVVDMCSDVRIVAKGVWDHLQRYRLGAYAIGKGVSHPARQCKRRVGSFCMHNIGGSKPVPMALI